MKKIEELWSISDAYVNSKYLYVILGLQQNYTVSEAQRINIDELDLKYDIKPNDLYLYQEDDPILLFKAIKMVKPTNHLILRETIFHIDNTQGFAHLILIHPDTNNSKKKIKRTTEKVSDAKLTS